MTRTDEERVGDIVLGVTMVLIGVTPVGLIATGQVELVVAGYGLGTDSETLNTALISVFTLCGLVLTVAGYNVAKYGRSESTPPSLY
ncbi:hypothetical protein ACFQE1_02455 [Halobium palmae]|uniref:Uncharacterized protein n=1 Tax=Halobium palmae TaxID=1776492 RepID=A0ABD5RVP2_9EURY